MEIGPFGKRYPWKTCDELRAWLADSENMRPQDHEIREKVMRELRDREFTVASIKLNPDKK